MSSCSVFPRLVDWFDASCLTRLSPRLLASAESRVLYERVDRAHLEFLRITDVTARISERTTCLTETGLPECMLVVFMMGCSKALPPTWKRSSERTARLLRV